MASLLSRSSILHLSISSVSSNEVELLSLKNVYLSEWPGGSGQILLSSTSPLNVDVEGIAEHPISPQIELRYDSATESRRSFASPRSACDTVLSGETPCFWFRVGSMTRLRRRRITRHRTVTASDIKKVIVATTATTIAATSPVDGIPICLVSYKCYSDLVLSLFMSSWERVSMWLYSDSIPALFGSRAGGQNQD
ncbi:hypothetical protein GGR53DRAFT_21816 [Hypoxylon sp. FL1150]|nr:hypothetical protein GGR53DRAFT_21816 [Hypoxylon sp. FL1150]